MADAPWPYKKRHSDSEQYLGSHCHAGRQIDGQCFAGRYSNGRNSDEPYSDCRYPYNDEQFSDERFSDGRYSDGRYSNGRYSDGRYSDGRYSGGHCSDGAHSDGPMPPYMEEEIVDSPLIVPSCAACSKERLVLAYPTLHELSYNSTAARRSLHFDPEMLNGCGACNARHLGGSWPQQRAYMEASPPSTPGSRRRRGCIPLVAGIAFLFCIFGIVGLGWRTRVNPNPRRTTPARTRAATGDALEPAARSAASANASSGVAFVQPPQIGGASERAQEAPPSAEQHKVAQPLLFADPLAGMTTEQLQESLAEVELFDFDEFGKKRRIRGGDFVAYNHPPKGHKAMLAAEAVSAPTIATGIEAAPTKPHALPNLTTAHESAHAHAHAQPRAPLATHNRSHAHSSRRRGSAAGAAAEAAPRTARAELPAVPHSVREVRNKYRNRKFLFPLLDQGPNNQYLQFRVALAKAHSMNRTLVLPLWLPHNPKFLHLHEGAPPEPSRDKYLDSISYPFESTFDPEYLSRFVRTIDLPTFRTLTDAKLELCLSHEGGFESYLRHSGLECESYSGADASLQAPRAFSNVRFLGYHSFDHEVGTRDRYYAYLRWSPPLLKAAEWAYEMLFNGTSYAAAHIRVADAHWDLTDCKHSINSQPVASVSCGDGVNAINYSSIAQELWYMLKTTDQKLLYVSTNMNCTDMRLMRIALMLSRRNIRLLCAKDMVREHLGGQDNYFVSLVEQELCQRANAFMGSKYSTWTDTVWGLRLHNSKSTNNYMFEELWALGIK